nr:reverse transcriptase domain-containing protein [Tanacetum cinerariifolium]
HPSLKCDEKPMGGPKDEEANYAYEGNLGGGYRGNYYGRSFGNWRDRQPRDENQNSQPLKYTPSVPPIPEKKFDESDFEKAMRAFKCSSRPTGLLPSNTQTNPKPNPTNDKTYRPPSARNEHVNSIFTWSGLTYNSPVNQNAKNTVIYDDSEDDADEAEKEVDAYARKKMEERYAKFIDLIKEVRINVPLVDVLASMPNYRKLLKDLMSNKSKIDQISVAFSNEECSTIIQNKLLPKLGNLGSFLIMCTVAGSVKDLALADLGTSINLMPYSLYASLSGNTLKPTRMSICLTNHTYQYLMGITENMLVQVGKFVFPADFVILQMEEDDKVPLNLKRPFLHTVDAIIRVKNKELNLGVGDDKITLLIDKSMQHSHSNDDTYFRMDIIDEVTEEKIGCIAR